jgi:outer membrane protein assembly factor BamE (lipoprotein component of BamABCDE complex)
MKTVKKMTRISAISGLLISMLLVSCSVPVKFGTPLTTEAIQEVSKGLSSQEVERRLGKPMAVGRNKEGQMTWSWYYLQANLPAKQGESPVVQRLTISFSGGKVVATEYDMSEAMK